MPAIRSSKGNSPDDSDNKKGKVPYAGRKNNKKNNILPCDVCGFVASRKADMTRHAKTHSPDSQKLPCSWEGCDYSTLQRSNLETHYRRHTKDKSNTCYDDPKCDFSTCDPASLLRHRKRSHGYIPGRRRKNKKNKKRVPVCVIRGAEPDASGSSSIASQFNTFSSSAGASTSSSSRPFSGPGEASTSGSSSSRPYFAEPSTSRSSSSRPFSAVVSSSGSFSSRPFLLPQPPSASPSAFPAASGLLRHQSQFPLSLQPSVTSSIAASYRTSQPRRQSHPYMYYPTSYSSVESEVTMSPFTPATSTFPCDFSQGGQYNSTSYGGNSMLLSPFPPWAGVNMAGTDGFSLAGQQQHSLAGRQQQLSSFPMTTQHPIHISSHHQTNFESPIEGLYGDASRYHPQYYTTPLDRDVAAASATSRDMMNATDLNTGNQLNQNYYRFYRGDWWME